MSEDTTDDEQTTAEETAEETTEEEETVEEPATEETDGEGESPSTDETESADGDDDDVADVVTVEHAPDAVEEATDVAEETVEEAAETVDAATDVAADSVADAGELVEETESLLRELLALDDDPESQERAVEIFDDLRVVADEAEELLGTVDASELPDAVDASELPDTVDTDDLPDAVASGDPGQAVELRNLNELIELTDLWDAVDVREFWRNKREFDDAVEALFSEDAGDDETDDGLLDDAADLVGDDESDDATDGDEAGDSLLDRESSLFGDDEEAADDAADAADEDDGLSKPELGMLETDESKQAAIQKKISDSVGEFRGSILDARERLEEIVEKNQERTEPAGQPDSRNPTAVSTMPTSRSDLGGSTRFSTVPEETRYSNAPNRPRIYGQRFDDAKEDDDD